MKSKSVSAATAIIGMVMLQACVKEDAPVHRYVAKPQQYITLDPAGRFSLGASESKVAACMGEPQLVSTLPNGTLVWSYKFSAVHFRNGRVVSWNNASRNLKTVGPGDAEEQMEARRRLAGQQWAEDSGGLAVPGGLTGGRPASGMASGATNPNTVQVRAHTRADGTYVAPSVRTTPDQNMSNNFSSRGNRNPYTGKRGSR